MPCTRIDDREFVRRPDQPRPEMRELDNGMKGGALPTNARAATAGYILRNWGVDFLPDSLRAYEYRLCLNFQLALSG